MSRQGGGIINKGRLFKIAGHVNHFIKKSTRDNLSAISGQSAFFLILSVVPLAMFAISLITLLTKDLFDESLIDWLYFIDKNSIIYKIIDNTFKRASSGTTIITAVISLWSAGRGIYIITDGISRIYRLPNKRIWLIKRIYAMGYTFIMLLMLLIMLAALSFGIVFGKQINAAINQFIPSWLGRLIINLTGNFMMGLSMLLALKMYLWRKIPDKRYYSVRALLPGVIITIVGWNVLMFGISVYTEYFSTSSVYGSLGTVALFMMMIYFMMYILLCGMQFNYIYRREIYDFRFKDFFHKRKEKKETKKLIEAKVSEIKSRKDS